MIYPRLSPLLGVPQTWNIFMHTFIDHKQPQKQTPSKRYIKIYSQSLRYPNTSENTENQLTPVNQCGQDKNLTVLRCHFLNWCHMSTRPHRTKLLLYLDYVYLWMKPCSVWHSHHVALGMGCICCTGGMCCGFAVELSGLNLGSGGFKTVDLICRQSSVSAEWFSSKMN